jgi:1,4-alpha-glucan branching enzyme
VTQEVEHDCTLLTDYDVSLFREGRHHRLYEKLGSHVINNQGRSGTYFALWAPNAQSVSVIGDFNSWKKESHHLGRRWDGSGIWEGFVPEVGAGEVYKYHVTSKSGLGTDKGDPFAFRWETPPKTGSVVWDLGYDWRDSSWMREREKDNALASPISVYEVHLGSWRRVPEDGNRYLTYREIASYLPDYASEMGFTHVEFLPLTEHPFYGSWGYQTTGYFAPTSRYGSPQDLMFLIDELHRRGIGVLLDWVPSHFPTDEHGLAFFDGTHLFEHEDPRRGFHPHWRTSIFNYGRREVRSFLTSSALFWLDRFHADGLRVDGVASMLYLDYGRKDGEWIPNENGGNENLEAVSFLKELNETAYREYPDIQMIAEESTAWPMVSRPTYLGGLGFGLKWDMGWMHDTLDYFSKDPAHRKYHQNQLTFSMWYAFTENFVLPLSHDEVVYGKGSLLNKMPGDTWQKFANLRLLLAYQFLHPGKKLLFMGDELAQWNEWYHEASLDWDLLQHPPHKGIQRLVKDLNEVYRAKPALHELDCDPAGFQWVATDDVENSVLAFVRKGADSGRSVLAVCNFTPVPRYDYTVGVPNPGLWKEILNSDAREYGGSGLGNPGGRTAESVRWHGRDYSVSITLPPLAAVLFESAREPSE